MWHAVTSDSTPDSAVARGPGLQQEARRRGIADEVAQEATRVSSEGLLEWAGAAAEEFPPGFAEFAQARARAISVARDDPSPA